MASTTFTGARAHVEVDGNILLLCTGVSVADEIQFDPVITLDYFHVVEHAPVGYDAAFAAGRVRQVGTTLRSLGLFPKKGQSPAEHLQNALNVKDDAVATITDSYTNTIVAEVSGVKIARRGYAVGPRALVLEDVGFVCLAVADEGDN